MCRENRLLISAHVNVPDIPNKPPGQPELQVVDAYSLKVKWQQPTRQEDEIIPTKGYIILVRFEHFVHTLRCGSFLQTYLHLSLLTD